jgi:hypothetical protein
MRRVKIDGWVNAICERTFTEELWEAQCAERFVGL